MTGKPFDWEQARADKQMRADEQAADSRQRLAAFRRRHSGPSSPRIQEPDEDEQRELAEVKQRHYQRRLAAERARICGLATGELVEAVREITAAACVDDEARARLEIAIEELGRRAEVHDPDQGAET
jgi:hypothetical protein